MITSSKEGGGRHLGGGPKDLLRGIGMKIKTAFVTNRCEASSEVVWGGGKIVRKSRDKKKILSNTVRSRT